MPSTPTSPHVPALTAAHQQQLRELIESLGALGRPDTELALLARLADDMPRLRVGLPGGLRRMLEQLDANEEALAVALRDLQAAAQELDAGMLPAVHLLDAARLQAWAEAAHALAQLAAEAALRAQQRAELLGRCEWAEQ
ncbi:hypothetical protein [Kouleothrix sp.]|uniref:hypothetical protein n=1 Tax=Kouleothrix sp. TaxID=2779161 RepID=UPI00391A81FD